MIPPFTGHCLCKAVTYRCEAEPIWQGHCHCASCRRATASPFTSFFGMRDGSWRWTGLRPTAFNSSPGVLRSFCPVCGTPMSYQSTRWPGETHFYAATLDDPWTYRPTGHSNYSERMPWIHLSDGLPVK